MYSEAVDLWSVGVILFILLSGDPPFDDRRDGRNISPIDFASTVMAGLPAEFSTIPFSVPKDSPWASVSPQACDLVQRLLTVDPRQRPSAREALSHAWFHSFGLAKQYAPSASPSAFSFSQRESTRVACANDRSPPQNIFFRSDNLRKRGAKRRNGRERAPSSRARAACRRRCISANRNARSI